MNEPSGSTRDRWTPSHPTATPGDGRTLSVSPHPIRGPPRELPVFIQLTKEFLGKKVGERIDVAEADAAQLVRQGVAVHVADDPLTPAVAKALEGAFARYNQGLD